MQHPGIPAVHQVGTLADGRPFLAMKLIKGSTLETILKYRLDLSAGRGPAAGGLAIFEAVCQAVGYAHAHRVIHRDLKPANVMVGAFGEVQVMDWGLAKVLGQESPGTADALSAEETRAWTQVSPAPASGSHTQAGSLVGTPAFCPPEQALGEIDYFIVSCPKDLAMYSDAAKTVGAEVEVAELTALVERALGQAEPVLGGAGAEAEGAW